MPILLPDGIEVTDTQLAALKDSLVDPEQWIRDALAGKLANCEKRLDDKWRPLLDADPEVQTVPADRGKRIELVMKRPEYQDRAARIEAGKDD